MDQHGGRATILEFIQKVCQSMIDKPDYLSVSYQVGEQTTQFVIEVHKDDMGKLIGKNGQNIGSIRTLVTNIATKYQLRAVVLVEE